MDVFGNTSDSERKQLITNLEDSIKITTSELSDKISTLEDKIIFIEDKINSEIDNNETRINGINKIISKLLDRLNTIQDYFEDKVSRKETVEEKARV